MTWHKGTEAQHRIVTVGMLGAHGGAGATTLARALHLPELDLRTAADTDLVVLAGLGHAHGARAIIETTAALGPDPRIVLALTATGWWTAPAARAMRRLLVDRVDTVIDLPWVWRWHDTAPSAATAGRRWHAAALALTEHIDAFGTPHPEGAHQS